MFFQQLSVQTLGSFEIRFNTKTRKQNADVETGYIQQNQISRYTIEKCTSIYYIQTRLTFYRQLVFFLTTSITSAIYTKNSFRSLILRSCRIRVGMYYESAYNELLYVI